jgi:hypothetical protein
MDLMAITKFRVDSWGTVDPAALLVKHLDCLGQRRVSLASLRKATSTPSIVATPRDP